MKVTVIGSGNMASGLVKQFAQAGHQVQIHALDQAQAEALAAANGARVVNAADAKSAEVILVATYYANAVEALRALGDLTGKVVIDITNPLTADFMGLTIGHSTSAAEEIAKALPGARIVKAFNTVFAQRLAAGAKLAGETIPVFVASDDAEAKATVTALVASTGFTPIDAGPLKNARYLEPLGGLNIYFGYGAGLGTAIAPTWIIEK